MHREHTYGNKERQNSHKEHKGHAKLRDVSAKAGEGSPVRIATSRMLFVLTLCRRYALLWLTSTKPHFMWPDDHFRSWNCRTISQFEANRLCEQLMYVPGLWFLSLMLKKATDSRRADRVSRGAY